MKLLRICQFSCFAGFPWNINIYSTLETKENVRFDWLPYFLYLRKQREYDTWSPNKKQKIESEYEIHHSITNQRGTLNISSINLLRSSLTLQYLAHVTSMLTARLILLVNNMLVHLVQVHYTQTQVRGDDGLASSRIIFLLKIL